MALEGGSQLRTVIARVREQHDYDSNDPRASEFGPVAGWARDLEDDASRAYDALEGPDQTPEDARRELAELARDPAIGPLDLYLAASAWGDLGTLRAVALFEPGVPTTRRRQIAAMTSMHHVNMDTVDETDGNIALWMSPESATFDPLHCPQGHPMALEREESGEGLPIDHYLACRLPVVGDAEARRDLRAARWESIGSATLAAQNVADLIHNMPGSRYATPAQRGVIRRWAARARRRIRAHDAWGAAARAAATSAAGRRGARAAAYGGAAACACSDCRP